jgi:hypothetical protein
MEKMPLHGSKWYALVGIIAGLPAATFAAPRVDWDSRGMPSCVEDSGERWCFQWKRSDHYLRRVSARDRSGNLSWPDLAQRRMGRIELPRRVVDALRQVEAGANEYRPEPDARTWLATHPVRDFDRATSRSLAERFGVGFTGEVLEAWVRQDRADDLFARDVRRAAASRELRPSPTLAETRIVVVAGFSVGPVEEAIRKNRMDFSEAKLVSDLRSMGLSAVGSDTAPYGDTVSNSKRVEAQLRRELANGAPVLVIAMSRGAAETLQALSRIGPEAGRNRIRGLILLSPLMRGSFIADWAQRTGLLDPVLRMVRKLGLRDLADRIDGVRHVGPRQIGPLLDPLWPTFNDIPFAVTVLGVPEGRGIARDAGTRSFQELVVRPFMSDYGANDGVLEHPDTFIPEDSFGARRRLVVRASHALWDGRWEGLRFSDTGERRAFVLGLLESSLELERR